MIGSRGVGVAGPKSPKLRLKVVTPVLIATGSLANRYLGMKEMDMTRAESRSKRPRVELQARPVRPGTAKNLENDHLIPTAEDLEGWERRLRELSRSKLRWGAMPLPNDLARALSNESGETVVQLGFGDKSANIRSSQEGGRYV
ncbi:hypothetical protein F5Y06DRAFT_292035 [Hypoxylon sp. FL0890]|nr:hypothetical protein F5Y06DRAFT_292035 [Hypoxylon sp. FL0890]